ncbi:MAG: hypothetical protein WAK01_17345 [Methylocystis sp.]
MRNAVSVIRTYDELIAALVQRRHELGLPGRAVDYIANLAEGHCSKLEGPSRAKRLGPISAPALLATYGARYAVLDDALVLAFDDDRLPARTRRYMHSRKVSRHKQAA